MATTNPTDTLTQAGFTIVDGQPIPRNRTATYPPQRWIVTDDARDGRGEIAAGVTRDEALAEAIREIKSMARPSGHDAAFFGKLAVTPHLIVREILD